MWDGVFRKRIAALIWLMRQNYCYSDISSGSSNSSITILHNKINSNNNEAAGLSRNVWARRIFGVRSPLPLGSGRRAQGSSVTDLAGLLVGSGGTSLWAHYSTAKLSLVPVTIFCLQRLATLQCCWSPVLGDFQRSSSPSWIVLGQRLVPMVWDSMSMGHSATHWPHFLQLPKGFISITQQQGQSVAGQPNLLL